MANYGELPARTSMACYLKMEGNSNDSSGNGRNGTDTSITYGLGNGKFGQGALFNATTDKISIPAAMSTTTLANSTTGTVSFWFNLVTVTPGAFTNIFNFVSATGATSLRFGADWRAGIERFEVRLTTDATIQFLWSSGNSTLSNYTGSWHHFCGTQDGTSFVGYIDGVAAGTMLTSTNVTKWFKAVITDPASKVNQNFIGSGTAGINAFQGAIDEVIVETTKCWTASEVRKYYNQCQGRMVAN